ncbi:MULTISPECIES: DNA phosphorothioation-dependent restriction protein DptG [Myroides]|uniref:DNA phosphorothioation-dependent restriction protein DptG n=1 Tax=Myroides TaxID=76831 RepID=UPI002574E94D|nr:MULTISPECIES: DNA phosphorothioation-dependent restriction protein DptG [Myroides]MDM1377707.1 DNA phosphorothioation-dependent restriction protein DptG [Myroides marinus]MDM1385089.1 DNA phosphorothioation-dependent restriction protein DptG [Myroides marinus]MDM1392191.1 DNA phosphorothioation-dependent restriction protein DptG [Myroides marinus]MEC4028520.1 DNA phosphorothioation-dependent restriction protein DptG [Myroides odoratimimus]
MKIELKREGAQGFEKRYFNKTTFRHNTGEQINLLPYLTNPSGDIFSEDFRTFHGIVGEIFRIIDSRNNVIVDFDTDLAYKVHLKNTILEKAVEVVETDCPSDLRNLLSKLFFDEENGLIKFDIRTLAHMNFISSNNKITNISKFIYNIFLKDISRDKILNLDGLENSEKGNLLYQLIIESLPELPIIEKTKSKEKEFYNLFPEIKRVFNQDFEFLQKDKVFFLKNIENFLKYYYFHYVNQLILKFRRFGFEETNIVPVFYTMDWETISESRLANHKVSWKQLNRDSRSLYAHVNALELINYIYVDDKILGDYEGVVKVYRELDVNDQQIFEEKLIEIIDFYTKGVTVFDDGKGWDNCEEELDIELSHYKDSLYRLIFTLWYKIKYQFENSPRSAAYIKYSKWYWQFAKINYTKNRGRLGTTTVLSQELLLFLTKLCIGNEGKIRLKSLWDEFLKRGIAFDEQTKLEIIKLFEKINLIEKKSDSGDAQYIKSTI